MFIFTLDVAIITQTILAVFLPIAVGLVTTRVTSSAKKAWLLASLSLVTSFLTQLGAAQAAHTAFDVGIALISVVPAFAISVATYYGLWKPTGVGQMAQDIKMTTLLK
jgi:hypothetical protein